jgi:4-aminobutyrate aminotransferase-like enzyme
LIGRLNESKFGLEGRVHFNVGGAQAIEDSLKIVRNASGKTTSLRFRAAITGARSRVGDHVQLSLPPPLRTLFRPRALRAVPLLLPLSVWQAEGRLRDVLRQAVRAQLRDGVQLVWDPKANESEFAAFYIEAIQERAVTSFHRTVISKL